MDGLQIAATLLGGGAVGAVITAVATKWRARQQPIVYFATLKPLFPGHVGQDAQFELTIFDGKDRHNFSALYVVEYVVTNTGNQDLKSFTFGTTLQNGARAVQLEMASSDRLHKIDTAQAPRPDHPQTEIDITVAPFNRKDRYAITIYVVPSEVPPTLEDLNLATAEPVRLVRTTDQFAAAPEVRLPVYVWWIVILSLTVALTSSGIAVGAWLSKLISPPPAVSEQTSEDETPPNFRMFGQ
jgi:hypothetical protein